MAIRNLRYDGDEILKKKYANRFVIVDAKKKPEKVFNAVYDIIIKKCKEYQLCNNSKNI